MNRSICTWSSPTLYGKSWWLDINAVVRYRDRRVSEDSILAIQIFDQKKFKKKDQGFLGVINVRIGSVIDLQMGGDGKFDDAGFMRHDHSGLT